MKQPNTSIKEYFGRDNGCTGNIDIFLRDGERGETQITYNKIAVVTKRFIGC